MATPDKPSSPSSPMDSPTDDELVIVLDPSGKDKLTVMNHDDYDAATMSRVTIKASTIKADAHDSYSNATEQFIDSPTLGNTGKAKSIFINLSKSDTEVGLGLKVIKGTQGALVREGHPATHDDSIDGLKDYSILLRDVNDKSGKQELSTRVGDLQKRINSTDSNNVFISNDMVTYELATTTNIGNRILPTTLGQHTKIETVASNKNQENRILGKEMQAIGGQIPLKGSGEYYIPKISPLFSDNIKNAKEIAKAIGIAATGAVSRALGGKLSVKDLSAKSVLNSVRSEEQQIVETSKWPKLEGEDSVQTYGGYNSWMVPFDGLSSKLQVPATIILVSAIAAPILAMAALIDVTSYTAGQGSAGDVLPGTSDLVGGGISGKDKFVGNVMVGFMALFGLNIESGHEYNLGYFTLAVATMAATKRVWSEYAWMNIVARSVIRDLTIGVPAEAQSLDLGSVDYFAHLLTESTIANFIHTLAELGEKVVSIDTLENTADKRKALWDEIYTNGVALNQSILISTDRIGMDKIGSKGQGKAPTNMPFGLNGEPHNSSPMSWGTGTTPSMYILPRQIYTAEEKVGAISLTSTLSELGTKLSENGRIEASQVKILEDNLNASYMPFYLHDLRTNEIISFHAFIESMQDSFSANYDSQTGLGRVEPIHIYKNSSRDMSLSFRVVSTNEQDHAEMWWKINRLLMMVYPQYTKGRELGRTTQVPDKFIQPYSQLVGASPMVRIRVGDVWKSNFSKFNVMRLFGLGETEFSLDTLNSEQNDRGSASAHREAMSGSIREHARTIASRIVNAKNPALQDAVLDYGDMFKLVIGNDNLVNVVDPRILRPGGGNALSDAGGVADFISAESDHSSNMLTINGEFSCKVTSLLPAALPNGEGFSYNISLKAISPDGTAPNSNFDGNYVFTLPKTPPPTVTNDRAARRRAADDERRNRRNNHPAYRNIEFVGDAEYIRRKAHELAAAEIMNIPGSIEDNSTGAITDISAGSTIASFFKGGNSADANPIMQAFESTSGQGIAGFISSIGIDWNDSRWTTDWDSERDSSRAPQMCKIDIKFLPVHDITPGIASNGFMTAPVYPVGKYANAFKDVVPDTDPNSGNRR